MSSIHLEGQGRVQSFHGGVNPPPPPPPPPKMKPCVCMVPACKIMISIALLIPLQVPELKTLERTEPIKKDYFRAEFLLSLPVRGYYTIQITASLLDHEDTLWQTGPKTTMPVLVDTDEGLKQRQQQQQRQKEIGSAVPMTGKSVHGHRV